MYFRLLLIFFLVWQTNISLAQDQVSTNSERGKDMLDQLRVSGPDSVFIDSLIAVGKRNLTVNTSFAKSVLTEAANLSDSLYGKYDLRYIEATHNYAVVLKQEGKFDDAIQLNDYVKGLRLKIFEEDNWEVMRSVYNSALCYADKGNLQIFEEQIVILLEQILNKKTFDPRSKIVFYTYFNFQIRQQKIDEAMNSLDLLFKIQEKSGEFVGLSETDLIRAEYYARRGDVEPAEYFIRQSVTNYEKSDLKDRLIRKRQVFVLGWVAFSRQNFDASEKYFLEKLNYSKNDINSQYEALRWLAILKSTTGDNKACDDYVERLIDLVKPTYNSTQTAQLYQDLSSQFGMYGNVDQGEKYIRKALKILKDSDPNSVAYLDALRIQSTSLQHSTSGNRIKKVEDAIKGFEEIRNTKNTDYRKSAHYYLSLHNLAYCYSGIAKTEGETEYFQKSILVRKEAINMFIENYNDSYNEWNLELFEKNIIDLRQILDILREYQEIISINISIEQFYGKIKDSLSAVKCLLNSSRIYVEDLLMTDSSLLLIDQAKKYLVDDKEVSIKNALINYEKGNTIRLGKLDLEESLPFYERSFEILDELKEFGLTEYSWSAHWIAWIELEMGSKQKGLSILQNATNKICALPQVTPGLMGTTCLNQRIDQYYVQMKYVSSELTDSLISVLEKDVLELDRAWKKYYRKEYNIEMPRETLAQLFFNLNNLKLNHIGWESLDALPILEELIEIGEFINYDYKTLFNYKSIIPGIYFDQNLVSKGNEYWLKIFDWVDSLGNEELYIHSRRTYASHLITYKIDIEKGLDILVNEIQITKKKSYNDYDLLIRTYADLGEKKEAINLLEEKQEYIIRKFGKESLSYLEFLDLKIEIYNRLGDKTNIITCGEEAYRLIEKLYPDDFEKQYNFLHPLINSYLDLGVLEKVDYIVQKKIEEFELTPSQFDNSYWSDNYFECVMRLYLLKYLSKLTQTALTNDFTQIRAVHEDLSSEIKFIPESKGKVYKQLFEFMVFQTEIIWGSGNIFNGSILEADKKKYLALKSSLLESGIDENNKMFATLESYLGNDLFAQEMAEKENEYWTLINYALETGDRAKADSLRTVKIRDEFEKFSENQLVLSEEQQLQQKNQFDFKVKGDLISIGIGILLGKNNISKEEYSELLANTSNLVSRSKAQLYSLLRKEPELKPYLDTVIQLNKTLTFESLTSERKNVLSDSLNYLEQQLFQKSKIVNNDWIPYQDLQSSLSEDEVLVQIQTSIRYKHDENMALLPSDTGFNIIAINRNSSADLVIKVIDLNEQKFIQSSYTSMHAGSNKSSNLKDELSYEYFWKPIAEKIGDAKTVYVSLGGVYNNINLNTLYNTETGKYLLEEKDIRIVNSARDFVLMKEREKKTYSSNTAALFGYPDYDGNSSATVDSLDYIAATRDLDPIWVDSLTRGGMKASLLPATKTEVENISATFSANSWEVSSYLESDASETAIKQLESPRVLHIATHGYFFEDIPDDLSNDRFMGMDRKQVVQNPMLRSGLLFTGANKTLQGEQSEGENGLLSAYEAALLDLSETELVVLSACETGRGEIKNSEGVYGLRKAIADAGAANIIMSLWKVDDNVTQEFMSTFYSTWLSGKTIREAFNETQLIIKDKYPQPYYWGAFVLVGE